MTDIEQIQDRLSMCLCGFESRFRLKQFLTRRSGDMGHFRGSDPRERMHLHASDEGFVWLLSEGSQFEAQLYDKSCCEIPDSQQHENILRDEQGSRLSAEAFGLGQSQNCQTLNYGPAWNSLNLVAFPQTNQNFNSKKRMKLSICS